MRLIRMEKSNVYYYDVMISRARVRQARGLCLTLTQDTSSPSILLHYLKITRPTGTLGSADHVILSFQKNLDRFYFPAGINTWKPSVRFLAEEDRHRR